MLRVTRPGGLVAVAEPNNLTESLLLDSISNQAGVDEIVELVRFQLTCERGKVALGEGDNSLGDRVPGLFVAQGLVDVEAHVNDRATAVFPPYAAAAQQRVRRGGARPPGAAPLDLERGRHAALLSCRRRRRRPTSPPTSRAPSPRASGSSAAWTTPPTTGSPAARSTWWRDERAARRGVDAQDCVARFVPVHLAGQRERRELVVDQQRVRLDAQGVVDRRHT